MTSRSYTAQWAGNMTILCATTSLMLRTYVHFVSWNEEAKFYLASLCGTANVWWSVHSACYALRIGPFCIAPCSSSVPNGMTMSEVASWLPQIRRYSTLLSSTVSDSQSHECILLMDFFLSSHGFRLYYSCLYRSRFTQKALCPDRLVEVAFPRWSCLLPSFFLSKLHTSCPSLFLCFNKKLTWSPGSQCAQSEQ